MHLAAAYFSPRELPGRMAGGLAWGREQESRALWLESQQPARIFFYDRTTRCAFSPLLGSGYSGSGGPCCQL